MSSIIWIPGESNIERWMYFDYTRLQLWMEMMDSALKQKQVVILNDRRE